jgi:uracil-DNA glycosylase
VVPDKRERLRELKERMEKHFLDTPLWFFEDLAGRVDGYWGTEPVMFVGERPSTGRGGLSRQVVGGFYDVLKEYGFARAHLTDLVKEAMKVGKPSREQVERNWSYFVEELQIIEPKVIVALGRWVFDTLAQEMNSLVPLVYFTHYAYRFRSKSKRDEDLRADFQRLRSLLDSQGA